MKITPNQVFLDGEDRFEPGQDYDLADDRARRVVSQGWATSPDLPAAWAEEWSGVVMATTPPAELVADDVSVGPGSQVQEEGR